MLFTDIHVQLLIVPIDCLEEVSCVVIRHRTRVWHFKNGGLGGFGGNPPGGNGGGFSKNSLKRGVWGVRRVSKNQPIEQSSKKLLL